MIKLMTLRFVTTMFCLNIFLASCADLNQSNKTPVPPISSSSSPSVSPSPIVTPSTSLQDNSNTSAQVPPPSAPSTMVKNLAIIDGVENDNDKAAYISSLLTKLDAKYPENAEQIGDMTAGAYGEIMKKGHSASIIGIMEAMMKVSEAKSNITYADAVTSYALLRVNGMQ